MTDDVDPLTTDDGEPFIPARRLAPYHHLARAAKAPVGSAAERYHLDAAVAESLARIEEHLVVLLLRPGGPS